jgi:hypothetical protein
MTTATPAMTTTNKPNPSVAKPGNDDYNRANTFWKSWCTAHNEMTSNADAPVNSTNRIPHILWKRCKACEKEQTLDAITNKPSLPRTDECSGACDDAKLEANQLSETTVCYAVGPKVRGEHALLLRDANFHYRASDLEHFQSARQPRRFFCAALEIHIRDSCCLSLSPWTPASSKAC